MKLLLLLILTFLYSVVNAQTSDFSESTSLSQTVDFHEVKKKIENINILSVCHNFLESSADGSFCFECKRSDGSCDTTGTVQFHKFIKRKPFFLYQICSTGDNYSTINCTEGYYLSITPFELDGDVFLCFYRKDFYFKCFKILSIDERVVVEEAKEAESWKEVEKIKKKMNRYKYCKKN